MPKSLPFLVRICGCVAVLTASVACSGDDNKDSSNMGVSTAGNSAGSSAAGTRASAGTSAAGSAGRSSGGAGSTSSPNAGSGAAGRSSGAGGATAGATAGAAADDDAGVPPVAGAGGAAAGSGGSAAGRGGAGAGGAAAAGSGGSGAQAATFTQVYALFMTNCAGSTCHVNATRAGDMLAMNDKATAYKNLVGVNAVSCQGEKRVVAGDPNKSELVHALARTQVGSCTRTPRMPEGKPMLSQADLDKVKSWVQAGALDN